MNAPTQPDTKWNDDEIIFKKMSPDTVFIFDRMTEATLSAAAAGPGERILDVACGRAKDALAMASGGARLFGIEASDEMLRRAEELLGRDSGRVQLARSLAETLPFADHAFDKVVCKGAMDHFADLEKSMSEMVRVTKADGRVIIAIANFESLTCRLGRALWKLRHGRFKTPPPEHPFWEPPADHNFKFDLQVLSALMAGPCEIQTITGVSLLWGFPKWGAFLEKLPPRLAHSVLVSLDLLGRVLPSLADVLIAVGKPRKKINRRDAEDAEDFFFLFY